MRGSLLLPVGTMLLSVMAAGSGMAATPSPPMARPGAVMAALDLLVVEGESLIDGALARGGNAEAQDMRPFGDGWSGGAQLLWSASGHGDSLTLTILGLAPGEYRIQAFLAKGPDFGIVQAQVNGRRAGPPFNGFERAIAPAAAIDLGTAYLQSGSNLLTLKVMGKDGRATGYSAGLDKLEFRATGN